MHLAFCLFKYFPHSGLAKDMLRVATEATHRGHQVDIYTQDWQGEKPQHITVHTLVPGGWTNHNRAKNFSSILTKQLGTRDYDAVVGFNKIPNLDFYYAADACFAARAQRDKPAWYRLTPRYKTWCQLEKQVFAQSSATQIFLLDQGAKLDYQAFYHTAEERLLIVPPNLDPLHKTVNQTSEQSAQLRTALGLGDSSCLLLLVGSGFRTKGVDRAIRALASLPAALRHNTSLVIAGEGRSKIYLQLARQLEVENRVRFLGIRQDVPNLLRACDLLIHPARHESGGAVLLEALAAGLPVITTASCGYAHHIGQANAGTVIETPFQQHQLNHALQRLIESDLTPLGDNARCYGQQDELYQMPQVVIEQIENRASSATTPLGFQGYVHPELGAFRDKSIDEWINLNGETFRQTKDRKTLRFTLNDNNYFLKAHLGIGWKEVFKNLFQLKKPVFGAENEWHAIQFLRRLGIRTLFPVAYGNDLGDLAYKKSFIVTRELTFTANLEDLAKVWRSDKNQSAVLKWRIIRAVADIARTLHTNGINHRDFYLCHFLIDFTVNEDDFKLFLIDLHRAQIRTKVPLRWRIKDIAGLYYSSFNAPIGKRDLFRFIKAYSGHERLAISLKERSQKEFWKMVEEKAHSLYRAEHRRGYADTSGQKH